MMTDVHPVVAAVRGAYTGLVDSCNSPLWSLTDAELEALDAETTALLAAVTGRRVGVHAEMLSRSMMTRSGAASPTAFLRGRDRLTGSAANRDARVAAFVAGSGGDPLRAGLWSGAVNVDQAGAIVAVLKQAPASATTPVRRSALDKLIDFAADYDADTLRRLGVAIWATLDPDAADADEERRLVAQERRAQCRRGLVGSPDGDGGVRIHGNLPDADWSVVNTALAPLAAPRPAAADGPDTRTGAQRNADALVELARRALIAADLPDDGGEPPQVVLTTTINALRNGDGHVRLDDGTRLSTSTARRIMCEAILIQVLLDKAGVPLSVGRRERLFRRAIRRALVLRDRGCAFPGCDRPPAWCQAHHIIPWYEGGPTSLDNGVLLCGHHHRLIHKGHWGVRLAKDGHPDFLPPPWIDRDRRPLRNHAHDALLN